MNPPQTHDMTFFLPKWIDNPTTAKIQYVLRKFFKIKNFQPIYTIFHSTPTITM